MPDAYSEISAMKFWVGVKSRPPQTVFRNDEEEAVSAEAYPQFAYVVGPFTTEEAAENESRIHVNRDGTFTDPFCNSGSGR